MAAVVASIQPQDLLPVVDSDKCDQCLRRGPQSICLQPPSSWPTNQDFYSDSDDDDDDQDAPDQLDPLDALSQGHDSTTTHQAQRDTDEANIWQAVEEDQGRQDGHEHALEFQPGHKRRLGKPHLVNHGRRKRFMSCHRCRRSFRSHRNRKTHTLLKRTPKRQEEFAHPGYETESIEGAVLG